MIYTFSNEELIETYIKEKLNSKFPMFYIINPNQSNYNRFKRSVEDEMKIIIDKPKIYTNFLIQELPKGIDFKILSKLMQRYNQQGKVITS